MNKFFGLLFFTLLLLFQSCQKPDKDIEFGNILLYIPQAVVQSGGSNNNFLVTISASGAADTLVSVGLYRSGMESLAAVTVDLITDIDTLQKAIQISRDPSAEAKYDIFKQAKLMPLEYYSVPAKMSLTDGQRDSYVYITINKAKLLSDPDFGAMKFILPLRITNPTKYSLNKKLSLVMFVFSKG